MGDRVYFATYFNVNSTQGQITGWGDVPDSAQLQYYPESGELVAAWSSPPTSGDFPRLHPGSFYISNSATPTPVARPVGIWSMNAGNVVANLVGTATLAGVTSGDAVYITGDAQNSDGISSANSLSYYRFKRSGTYQFRVERWPSLPYYATVVASHASW